MNAPEAAPRRELGAFTCAAIGITAIVGSGIFALPPALAASAGPLSFLAFLAAALVISLIGLMTAEAAGTTDRTGGAYEYARLAFGPWTGYGVAWLAWVNLTIAGAWISRALVKLLEVADPRLGDGAMPEILSSAQLVAFGAINAFGVKPGALVSNALTVSKLVPLALFVLIGLLAFDASSFEGAGARLAAAGTSGFAVAVYRCIFAAGGFECIGVVAGEARDPKRAIPRAVLISIAVSSALYAGIQLAACSSVKELATIVPAGLPGSMALPIAGERAAGSLWGASAGTAFRWLLFVGATVSMLGSCSAYALVGPRYLFAMATGGFLPRALLATNARGAPVLAIAAQTAVAVVLVWNVSWLALLDVAVLISLTQHSVTTLAAWKLRRTVPTEGRFIAPGGALAPVLALLAVGALVALAYLPAGAPGAESLSASRFVALGGFLAVGLVLGGATRAMTLRASSAT